PYLIVDLKLCNRTPELIDDLKDELSIEEIERIRQSLEEKENQLIEAIDQTETVEGG
ncbi:TPA: hypothetical protein LP440_002867, partial [Enterococcus faecium]|nr:hypothetical protein [Enterococcus faecium]